MIRRIRDLLYDQGFTISGARNKMQEILQAERDKKRNGEVPLDGLDVLDHQDAESEDFDEESESAPELHTSQEMEYIKRELLDIRELLMAPA